MKETLEIVLQGGALGLLALLLLGAIYIAASVAPSIKGFFDGHTTTLNGIATRLAVVDTKVDDLKKSAGEHEVRLRELAEAVRTEVTETREAVRAEAFDTRNNLHAFERRATAAIHRQHTSEPPPPISRPSAVPNTGSRPRLTG